MEIYSLTIFVIFFLITFYVLAKKDILIAGLYFFLFVYTIFSQIGYVFVPELSGLLNAYFGKLHFYYYHYFVFLSFLTYFLISYAYVKISKPYYRNKYKVFYINSHILFFIYVTIYSLYLLVLLVQFITNYDALTYASMPNGEYMFLGILFKYLTIFTFAHYAVYRSGRGRGRGRGRGKIKIVFSFLTISLILHLLIATKIGSRTDLVALFIGVSFYEIYLSIHAKNVKKTLGVLSIFALIAFVGLNVLEAVREPGKVASGDLLSRLLFKDYFAPGHILIAAMYYDLVNPVNVVLSNFYNSLIMMDYPYLQTAVGDSLVEGSSSRSTGFAMYIFSEGYMFAGWLGFIYNGLVVSSGIILWRWFSRSDNISYNAFIIGLTASQLANMARGQSSYFVKDIYIVFMFAVVLYFVMTGIGPRLVKKSIK